MKRRDEVTAGPCCLKAWQRQKFTNRPKFHHHPIISALGKRSGSISGRENRWLIMEAYQESVRSVDAALRRLNATLASYNMSTPRQAPSTAASAAKSTPPRQPGASNSASPPVPVPGNASKSAPAAKKEARPGKAEDPPAPTLEEQKAAVWRDIVGLRAHQQLTEVCAFYQLNFPAAWHSHGRLISQRNHQ